MPGGKAYGAEQSGATTAAITTAIIGSPVPTLREYRWPVPTEVHGDERVTTRQGDIKTQARRFVSCVTIAGKT